MLGPTMTPFDAAPRTALGTYSSSITREKPVEDRWRHSAPLNHVLYLADSLRVLWRGRKTDGDTPSWSGKSASQRPGCRHLRSLVHFEFLDHSNGGHRHRPLMTGESSRHTHTPSSPTQAAQSPLSPLSTVATNPLSIARSLPSGIESISEAAHRAAQDSDEEDSRFAAESGDERAVEGGTLHIEAHHHRHLSLLSRRWRSENRTRKRDRVKMVGHQLQSAFKSWFKDVRMCGERACIY